MIRVGLVVALLLAVVLGPAPVQAQSDADREQARTLQRAGIKLYEGGEYLQALEKFKQVWDLVQTPKVHFNLGETYFQLGRTLEALRHYELFVQGVKEAERPEEWARSNAQIAKLQGQIATVLVQCTVVGATVTVDGSVAGKTPMTQGIRVMPGAHVVLVDKPGHEQVVINVKLAAGEVSNQRVELLGEEAAAGKRKSYQKLEAQRRADQERLRVEQERSRSRAVRTRKALRISGWTGLGAGAAALIVGGTCGLLARKEASTIEGAQSGTAWLELQPHKNRYDTYKNIAYYGLGVGAGLAVAGGVLLLVSYRRGADEAPPAAPGPGVTPEPRGRLSLAPAPVFSAVPAVGPNQLGMVVSGRF
jgi:hypothetical protein